MAPLYNYHLFHLRCADFVESDKDEGLHKAAQSDILVQPDRGSQEQNSLGDKGKDAHRQGEPAALYQVQHVEVHREVVSCVSPSDVV